MKKIGFFVGLCLFINASAFAQYSVVGLPEALSTKDFPQKCASQCAEIARLWGATGQHGYSFYGCGNWTRKWGHGSDDGTIAGAVRVMVKSGGKDAVANAIKSSLENTDSIKTGKLFQSDSAAVREYFLKNYELDRCVLSEFSK